MLDNHELAECIVNKLKNDASPKNSTWGSNYEKAWDTLFSDYYEDILSSVEEILEEKRD